ncbi:hypothetical protein [Castellaniella sp.]|uniref:hypothetical protein n=1 Tax=Castellaniella sp. TaxID=1955812 RepID=UPI002AFF8ECD|nr:hypothetical protein [Castellaniella sp.]
MHIVIPGAWPDPEVATELAPHLAQRAPTLAHWLGKGKPVISPSLAANTWCTPLEHWLLDAHGFIPAPAEHISAGLGPLRAPTLDDEPVWLAELIHMAPSRDGAALLPADTLAITTEQSEALWASAQAYLEDGLQLEPLLTDTWRVRWPSNPTLPCASPALVAVSAVNDWWPQAPAAQPWRRLVNTLQMAWFEHPINLERQRNGQPPINSLWLYGGARPSQLTTSLPPDLHIDTRLQALATAQRWGEWIEALADLDQQLLAPMASQHPILVLGGRDRYASVTVSGGWLARLKTQDWRRWWCSR